MSIFWFLLATTIRAFFALTRSALINMRRARLVELEQRGVTSARGSRAIGPFTTMKTAEPPTPVSHCRTSA